MLEFNLESHVIEAAHEPSDGLGPVETLEVVWPEVSVLDAKASRPIGAIQGARRAPGPTIERARDTKTKPTSFPAHPRILRLSTAAAKRQPLHPSGSVATDGQLLRRTVT